MQPFFDETPHATPPAATGTIVTKLRFSSNISTTINYESFIEHKLMSLFITNIE